jgi:hypothetical protein
MVVVGYTIGLSTNLQQLTSLQQFLHINLRPHLSNDTSNLTIISIPTEGDSILGHPKESATSNIPTHFGHTYPSLRPYILQENLDFLEHKNPDPPL